jgi:aldehyde dehydrogenase (NAD+)
VINFINGQGKVAGAAIAQHPDIDKIAFTGSTATGKEVMKQASGTLKNITLETGGKSPLIVFEDADLDQAVKWSHLGIMSNMGQICSAVSLAIYVTPHSIHESSPLNFHKPTRPPAS